MAGYQRGGQEVRLAARTNLAMCEGGPATAKPLDGGGVPGLTEAQKKLQDLNEEAKKKSESAQRQSSQWWSYVPIGSMIAGKSRLEADEARQAAEQQSGQVVGMAQRLRGSQGLESEGVNPHGRKTWGQVVSEYDAATLGKALTDVATQLRENNEKTSANTRAMGSGIGEAPRPSAGPGVRP